MNKQDRIELFRNIVYVLNQRLCNDRIVIKDIVLFKKSKRKIRPSETILGYYENYGKIIGIKKSTPLILQIEALCHELAHAYQCQILGYKLNRLRTHDKKGKETYKKFIKEIDKILKWGLKPL